MNLLWDRTPTPDQLTANQNIPNDNLHCAFVDPPSSLGAKDMLEYPMLHSNTASNQISSPNYYTRPTVGPSVGPWTSDGSSSCADHSRRDFAQDQYSMQFVSTSISQALTIPPPQVVYSYSNTFPFVSDYDSCNNTPTLHSTQYHNPVLGGASIGNYSPAMESGYSFSSISRGVPSSHSSRPSMSSQYTVANHIPFISDPNMSPSYNTLPHQWQTPAVPQPAPLKPPFTPMIPPPLTAESSQPTLIMQPHASSDEKIGYPSNQPPINQLCSFPPHSHPSPPLLSCRWLNGDAVTYCGFTGTLGELRLHCKAIHFTGSSVSQIECHWEGCDYCKRNDPTVRVMRRSCVWRHICEIHLKLKRGCT